MLKDNAFPQLLMLLEFAHRAADRIYRAIVASSTGEKAVKPIMRPYDPIGSTRYVDFDTTRETFQTRPDRCHVSHVVLDSNWEAKLAQSLEGMGEVLRYVRNQGLGFRVPYAIDGEERAYLPDYIVVMDDGRGVEDPLNLILEVSGEPRKDKAAKVDTARTLWVPAVNNHGGFGRWAFIEVSDPWDAQSTIRAMLRKRAEGNRDGRKESQEDTHRGRCSAPQGQAGQHPHGGAP